VTDPRARLGTSKSATTAASLPALVPPKGVAPDMARWINAVTERLQVREGQRGNQLERAVTHRELQQTYGIKNVITAAGKPGTIFVQDGMGNTIALSAEHFASMIQGTRLWQDLSARIDDPNRFNRFGDRVKALLLPDLAELAAKQGAAIQSIDTIIQSAGESFAARQTTLTAAVGQVVAGIRETLWASANNMAATAGYALQITSRLDDFDGGAATIEEVMTTTASRIDGLAAEWYIKVNAGNAVANIGLSADQDPSGTTHSAFIVQADQMAFTAAYNFSQELTPTATAIGQLWYKPSTKVSYRATATGIGGWVTFTPKVPLGIDTVNDTIYIAGTVLIDAGGTALGDLPALSTSYWLVSSVGAVSRDTTATYVPATITFSGYSAVGTSGPAAYSGRFKIYHSHGRLELHAGVHVVGEREQQDVHTSRREGRDQVRVVRCRRDHDEDRRNDRADRGRWFERDHGGAVEPFADGSSDNSGVVSSYTNTGTTIQVYEGATLLTFTTGTIGNSKFTCGTPTQSPSSTLTVGRPKRATARRR
jgi:hypothetical protein